MAYENFENTVDDGRPVELYEFRRGSSYYRYTNAAEKVYMSGNTFTPEYITRSEITETDDINQGSLTVTFSIFNQFAGEYISYAPDTVTTLTIYRLHVNDDESEGMVIWKGRVLSSGGDENEIELECESIFSSLRRVGLRAKYLLICRHALYSSECGISMSSYVAADTVTGEDGLTIIVGVAANQGDGTYTGGIVENASGDYRFITKHEGATLKLSRSFSSSINGTAVQIYPGCDKLRATCIEKFNNLKNFGGFPFIPTTNPFDGRIY